MDIPSLFMIPSAVSSGKVHSVFPNSTDADFDFNRDSDATRVNSEGLIERVGYYGSELVTDGDFSSSSNWYIGTGCSISNGQAIFSSASGGSGFTGQNANANICTIGKTYKVTFTIVSISEGGLKIRFPFNSSNIHTEAGTYTEYGVSTNANIYIQNSGTTTAVIDNVSIKEVTGDRARLNYEIEGGLVNTKPSLLLENQSTNEVTYSEKLNEWSSVGGVTLTSDIAKSPDGSISADGIQDTTGGSFKRIRIVKGSLSPNSTFTASVFVKKETSQINFGGIALVYQNVSTATSYGIIDAVNGTIVNGSGSITPTFNVVDFGNYWRFEMTSTDNGSNTAVEFAIYGTLSNNGTSLGVGAGSVRTIWGAQLEQQSYSTSYIPTNGSTQTRAAETCNGAGTSSIFNDSEGILYAEIQGLINGTTGDLYISISDNSVSNSVALILHNTANRINFRVYDGGSLEVNISDLSTNQTQNLKVACKYKSGNYALWINGVQSVTASSGSLPSGLSKISFNDGAGSNSFYGKVKDIRVYNTKEMTDSEVDILLTKITS